MCIRDSANANANTNGFGFVLETAIWQDSVREKLFTDAKANLGALRMSEAKVITLVDRIARDASRKTNEVKVRGGVEQTFVHRHGDFNIEVGVFENPQGLRTIRSARVTKA